MTQLGLLFGDNIRHNVPEQMPFPGITIRTDEISKNNKFFVTFTAEYGSESIICGKTQHQGAHKI